jgi:hypothetical protein
MKPIAKRLVGVMAAGAVAALGWHFQQADSPPVASAAPATALSPSGAREAFEQRARGRMLLVEGRVTRILSDDRDGSPHQRFIIVTNDGQSLLVAHNLDLAPRLDGLEPGHQVSVYGEYEWNEQGGVMHWTHDDPRGAHAAGYIDWQGRRYQ